MTFGLNELRMPDPGKVYRVVQWASGRTGKTSGRAVIRHPYMDLVGMWVHSPEKEGRDAGELCGVDPIGIKTTRAIDDVIALKPDCVLYMQTSTDLDQICRLLEAGINIITTMGDFHYPPRMDPAIRARVEDACARGGASIHSSGVSPGFISESLPLLLTSVSRRIDSITIDEFANLPPAVPADMLIGAMGFGRSAGDGIDPKRLEYTAGHFSHSLGVVADALGLAFDDIRTTGEVALARNPVELPGGRTIEKGTVASQRITVAGMIKGRALISMRLVWYCSTDTDPAWKVQESGWHVVVEGDAPFDIAIALPETEEPRPSRMAGYSVYRAINEIPYVCAAAPGICTSADLPQIVPTGLE
ncbi:MAG: dihydrodipicolinate reductase [Novosphingobium sp.]